MVEPTQSGVDPREATLETAVQNRLRSLGSGQYRRANEHVLEEFVDFQRDRGNQTVDELTPIDCRRYARYLNEKVETDTISAATAERYYAYVRAWLGWCIREELIDTNPAATNRAEEPLPEDSRTPDRQYWSQRDRTAILATADRRVDVAHEDANRIDHRTAERNRALLYLLAYSGARGAELLRDPSDPDRDGLHWRDVNLEDGTISVLGKSRDGGRQHVGVPKPGVDALERWSQRSTVDPDRPVFPRTDPGAGASPPSITVASLRNILDTYCEWSQYDFEEVLKPHGARRGLGRQLYQESPQLAQYQLRHQSVETTRESYAELAASDIRDDVESVLLDDAAQQRVPADDADAADEPGVTRQDRE